MYPSFVQKLEDKTRSEMLDVDTLKAKSDEMLSSGQQLHAASQAREILDKLEKLKDRLQVRKIPKTFVDERTRTYID